jgi:hypothetical protein
MIVIINNAIVNLSGFKMILPFENKIQIMYHESTKDLTFELENENAVETKMHQIEQLLKNY